MAEESSRKNTSPRKRRSRSRRWAGQAHGDPARAPQGAAGPAPGGNKWIGTAGTSPFGAHGYNPEGVRIGQDKNRNNRAVKVWDKREFQGSRRQCRARHPQHQDRAAAACANSPAPARRTSSTRHHDQGDRPTTAISTCICAPSGATRSRFWYSSTSVAPWIPMSSRSRSCSRRRRANSSTWNISTSTIASNEGVWKQNKRRFNRSDADLGRAA